jgi:hypothetical protein
METFIILLGVALLIVCLRVVREMYLKQNTLAMYARTFDAHIHDDDNNNAYKMYVYNSLRVQ